MVRKLLPLLVLAVLVLTACAAQPAVQGSGSAASPANKGQELFALNCGECHSKDASGTDEAPALYGHTADQVTKQVRRPEGDMKAILPDKLSDADLAVIVQYVTGLGGKEAHPEIKPGAEEITHLTAAYMAIEDHEHMDRQTALNHLEQAIALSSGEATEFYKEMVASIQAEKAGNTRHELKEFLGMEEGH